MDINLIPVLESQRKTPPADMSKIVFGTRFTDHMFLMEWDTQNGWHNAKVEAYHNIELAPSSIIFHYGPEAFEGLKAYYTCHGKSVTFRARNNFERMNRTCQRMCLPELDVDFTMKALNLLLKQDLHWIPRSPGTSLYIRPTLIGVEPALGLKVSNQYLFFIIMCPVGPYYPEGFNPVKIKVSDEYCRATPGGVGNVKTAGNYAASVLAEKKAKTQGYTQVLWLDAVERKYVEEVGSMNIFFVIKDEIITPQLTGTILPGITRQSVLDLGRHWDKKMVERRISIDEVIQSIKNGSLTEMFGSGTAAVISPVAELQYKEQTYTIGNGQIGPMAQHFFDEISSIQYGQKEAPFPWIEVID
ncbi:branched-chain amino acid aminotransferase [Deltaproteobacteria bacterium TL4]